MEKLQGRRIKSESENRNYFYWMLVGIFVLSVMAGVVKLIANENQCRCVPNVNPYFTCAYDG